MVAGSNAVRAPHATRRRILEAAFAEFYANGFQGGSLNHIVEMAGTTKGALFHHFDGKQELGYAVVDEIIGPLLLQRWLEPVKDSTDPVTDLQAAFRRFVAEDIRTGAFLHGCPMNNLAQEMSPLDDGFYRRINGLYDTWREHYTTVLERGIERGSVKADVQAKHVAAFIVAAQMGIWGSGKSSRNQDVMRLAGEGLCGYLESLRP